MGRAQMMRHRDLVILEVFYIGKGLERDRFLIGAVVKHW